MKNFNEKKVHVPVMLEEAINGMNITPQGFYVDCTLGEGGHSSNILSLLGKDGILLSVDRDINAIDFVKGFYKDKFISTKNTPKWLLFQSNYSELVKVFSNTEIKSETSNRKANGILMDLGLSSRQLEVEPKGFSYIEESQPLDMRMDENLAVTAKDLLNVLLEGELTKLFRIYGEERFAGPIAREIKANIEKINTVGDLVKVVYKVIPSRLIKADKHHPARRIFQALRIAVNDEINSLNKGIDGAFECLDKKGRLVIITFHSLEDRAVKQKFDEYERKGIATNLTKKHLLPSETEINSNPRSHSAKMRILEKL
jgi:16S rRNA (cytosine1402-N4)-methyltransferase